MPHDGKASTGHKGLHTGGKHAKDPRGSESELHDCLDVFPAWVGCSVGPRMIRPHAFGLPVHVELLFGDINQVWYFELQASTPPPSSSARSKTVSREPRARHVRVSWYWDDTSIPGSSCTADNHLGLGFGVRFQSPETTTLDYDLYLSRHMYSSTYEFSG